MFYQLYKKSDFNQKADGLISKLRTEKGILILDVHKDFDKKEISFAVVGKSISQSDIQQFKSQMKTFGYESCNFKVLQDAGNLETISKINEIENSFLSNQQLIVKKSQELLDKDKEIFELKNRKDSTQPTKIKTSGSTFKNPTDQSDKKVWQLIKESVPLEKSFGDACISEKHCNFFVNKGNAKFDDMKKLIEFVSESVLKKTGIKLQTEIKILE